MNTVNVANYSWSAALMKYGNGLYNIWCLFICVQVKGKVLLATGIKSEFGFDIVPIDRSCLPKG